MRIPVQIVVPPKYVKQPEQKPKVDLAKQNVCAIPNVWEPTVAVEYVEDRVKTTTNGMTPQISDY